MVSFQQENPNVSFNTTFHWSYSLGCTSTSMVFHFLWEKNEHTIGSMVMNISNNRVAGRWAAKYTSFFANTSYTQTTPFPSTCDHTNRVNTLTSKYNTNRHRNQRASTRQLFQAYRKPENFGGGKIWQLMAKMGYFLLRQNIFWRMSLSMPMKRGQLL